MVPSMSYESYGIPDKLEDLTLSEEEVTIECSAVVSKCELQTLTQLCYDGVATKGGGIYFAGDDVAGSNGVGIIASHFTGNNAQSGGAMYAGPGARGLVAYTTFDSNTAKSYGGALLVDDDSQMQISNTAFTNNGRYSCYDPPMVCLILHKCRTFPRNKTHSIL